MIRPTHIDNHQHVNLNIRIDTVLNMLIDILETKRRSKGVRNHCALNVGNNIRVDVWLESRACFKCSHQDYLAKYEEDEKPSWPTKRPWWSRETYPDIFRRKRVCTCRDVGKYDIVVIGTLSILGHYALTLFDSGFSRSFISVPFFSQAGFQLEPLLHVLSVSTPTRVDLVFNDRVKDGQVIVARWTFSVDLIVVSITNFDVIL